MRDIWTNVEIAIGCGHCTPIKGRCNFFTTTFFIDINTYQYRLFHGIMDTI